jgi:putative MATE family efflux protein
MVYNDRLMATVEKSIQQPEYPHRVLNLRPSTLNRTIALLAAPAVFENLLFSLVSVADIVIVGWLRNENYLAGVALASLVTFWAYSPIQALAIGANSIVSRTWGERNFHEARRVSGHALLVAVMAVLTMLIAGYPFAEQIIRMFGAAPDVVTAGAAYLRIILISTILGMPLMVSNAIIRAKGDTASPMVITGIMNVINVVSSIVLAFGYGPFPEMGLYGVAWGTLLSRNIGGLLSLAILFTHKRGISMRMSYFTSLRLTVLRRIWHVSYPVLVERVLNTTSYAFFMWMVARLGTTVLAAHQIALNIESLVFMPSFGIGMAVSSIIGQAVGARRYRIGELTVKRTLWFSGTLMVLIAVLFVIFAPHMVMIFKATPEVLEQAEKAVRISAMELPLFALYFIFLGALRGAGDTRSMMVVIVCCITFVRLPGTWLLAFVFDLGISGVWLATAMDWACRTLGLWMVFRRGIWKTIHQKEKARFAD